MYLTLIQIFYYNEKVTKVLYFLSFGAWISLIVIDAANSSILNIRYFHYVTTHISIITVTTYLVVKHKLFITFNDFLSSLKWIYVFITLMLLYGIKLSPEDSLFLFAPLEGSPLELLPSLPLYTIVMYFMYTPFFLLPYIPWGIKKYLLVKNQKLEQTVN